MTPAATKTAAPPELKWPSDDYTRTPYEIYADPMVFEAEQAKLFRGPAWHFLGFESEVPNPGDYTTCYVGTTQVVLSRNMDNELHCFVNRCSHRGAAVVRKARGNASSHSCIYHQWCYGPTGELIGVPLMKGVQGQGGYPTEFCKEDFGLERLRVQTHAGIVFGTFHQNTEPLIDYLGEDVAARLELICGRPLKVTGYQHHTINCNWKLFCENSRDPYHAPLLHPFLEVFGILKPTDKATCVISKGDRHSILTAWAPRTADGAPEKLVMTPGRFKLEDPEVVGGFVERDGMTLSIVNVFPATLFTIVDNCLSVRQIRPKAHNKVELAYTWFTYLDDDESRREIRRKQNNLFGPAGFIAMEDAEALELIQNSIPQGLGIGTSYVAQGGREVASQEHMVTEVPIRAFWKSYCAMMDIPVADQPSAA
jgi:phenylpropionate dioxygenase-like ring-hydroxylating dioxygenase large terminal subunit